MIAYKLIYCSYFVGDFEKVNPKCSFEVDAEKIAAFELDKLDPSCRHGGINWDKDTSRWQW